MAGYSHGYIFTVRSKKQHVQCGSAEVFSVVPVDLVQRFLNGFTALC